MSIHRGGRGPGHVCRSPLTAIGLGGGAGLPTLGTLSLSATTFTVGTPSSGTISGATTGSTITATGLPTGITINSGARTWAYDGTGSATAGNITLTETLVLSTNSPHSTVISYTVSAAGLATPTLTNYSALGTAPVTLQWSDTDYTVGLFGQLQIDQTSNAFANITQNIVFFIDGSSWALGSESIGLVTPSGTYYARIRACRDDDSGSTTVTGFDPSGNAVSFTADVSAWSNTFSDTINASVNVWNTTTGTNKSQYVTVSGTPSLVVTGTTGVGAPEGVRGVTATTGKRHFEIKVTSRDGTDPLLIGIDDGTTALGPALFNAPNPGVYYTGGNIYKNGTAVQTGLATLAANDVLAVEFDTVGGTVSFYKNGTQIGTTVTSVSFSSYYSYCATDQGSVLTANFGSSTFTMTPSSGYNGW